MATTGVPRRSGFLRSVLFRQVIFAHIAALAGATGLVLLAIPGSTASFFSWGLTPAAVAALIGGLYVGSASTFGLGILQVRTSGRGLCLMSIVFTTLTLKITIVHLGVFDFGRWQAWLWMLLFAGAPLFFVLLLALGAWDGVGTGPPPTRWARGVLVVLAVAAVIGAAMLWIDPVGSGAWLPFAPPPLGGRFLGVWLAVLAFAATWSAVRPWEEGRTTAFAVAALLAGALAGTLRSYGDLEPGGRVGFLAVLAVTALAAVAVVARGGGAAGPTGPAQASAG